MSDAGCIGLKEIDLVCGAGIDCAGEESEKDEDDGTGREEEGEQCEHRACADRQTDGKEFG